jgi:hypothetical protein
MSGSLAAVITIPIVTAIALFGWVAAVLYANAHPGRQRGTPMKTEVAGGAFQAVEGGRQLMPIPEHRPLGVPGPRRPGDQEAYDTAGVGHGASAGPGATDQQSTEGQQPAGQSAGQGQPSGVGRPPV